MYQKFLALLFAVAFVISTLASNVSAQQQQPGYEKFGRIATAVVKEDYPGEEVVEYKYLGRETTTGNKVVDSFRFQVMENGKQQIVVVRVTHDLADTKELTLKLEVQNQ